MRIALAEASSHAHEIEQFVHACGDTYVVTAKLPEGVDFAMLDINQQDWGGEEWARVKFFPNGTCDELTVVLHDRNDWRKISLEFATGHTRISAVDR